MPVTRLIQLSDCHLGGEFGERLLGLDTDESFSDVLSVLKSESPDALVASGDISSKGAENAYSRFLEYMQDYKACPMGWLPGNHDDASVMAGYDQALMSNGFLKLGSWELILLDSSIPRSEYGCIADAELERLEQLLSKCNGHVMVFVHHQPVPVGSTWLDQYTISNGESLLSILDKCPQVKALCWGHVHQVYESRRAHYALLSAPSTCIQFMPGSEEFALDTTMPGYRWFDLHDDGRVETGLVRVSQKDYGIDFSSSGY